MEIRIFYGLRQLQEFFIHLVDIPGRHRKIVGGIIVPFPDPHDPADIQLKASLEGRYVSHDMNIVQFVKFRDPAAVGIPYLGVDGARLVLQHQ